jgi:antitoxin Phd
MTKINQTWQLQTAKSKFSAVVNKALEGTPQLVTKKGKPAVYVISAEEYEKLKGRRSFKKLLLNSPHKTVDIQLDRQKDSGRSVNI